MKALIVLTGAAAVLSLCLLAGGWGTGAPTPLAKAVTGAVRVDNIRVENYFELGRNTQYFTSVPKRVLVVGANEAETLLDLGADEAILAIADGQNNQQYGIKAANRERFEQIPQVLRGHMNREYVLSLAPDMIVAEQEFYAKNRLGSTDYWNEKGVYTMVPLNTTSPGKLNQKETIEKEMAFIRDMGRIFHREERAERIISDTYARIETIRQAVKDVPKPKVLILDKISITASYGRDKIAGDMAAAIGGEVVHTPAAVSDEQIMSFDPDVVFLVTYDTDRTTLDMIGDKPAFQHLSFIRNRRLYPIPLKYVYGPETRTIDAIGYMAEKMYPGRFHFPKEYEVPE